jgi:hypothetical protein
MTEFNILLVIPVSTVHTGIIVVFRNRYIDHNLNTSCGRENHEICARNGQKYPKNTLTCCIWCRFAVR